MSFFDKMKAKISPRRLDGAAVTALVICLAAILNIIFYMLGNRYGLYLMSEKKDYYDISENSADLFTDELVKGKTVKVIFCDTEDNVSVSDTGYLVLDTVKKYAEKYDFIEYECINMLTNPRLVEKYKTDMDGNEQVLRKTTVIFECGDYYFTITDAVSSSGYGGFYNLDENGAISSYNGDLIVASMAAYVLTGRNLNGDLPEGEEIYHADGHLSVYFVTGHGERADTALYNLLICAGYHVGYVNTRSEEIPEDAAFLIISNPIYDFEKASSGSGIVTESEKIKRYVAGGGDVYISVDPYTDSLPVFEELLGYFGMKISRNIVSDRTNAITSDGFTFVAETSDSGVSAQLGETFRKYSSGRVIMRDSTSIDFCDSSFATEPLLLSSPDTLLKRDGETVGEGSAVVAALSKAESGGNIVLVGGSGVTAYDAIFSTLYANRDFMFAVSEIFGAEYAPYGITAAKYDVETLENLTMGTARAITIVLVLVIPALIGAAGIYVYVRRKNR